MSKKSYSSESEKTIKTHAGTVKGVSNGKVLIFRSIRYAQSKRFELPTILPESRGTAEQSERIPVCPQNLSPFLDEMMGKADVEQFKAEESCQFLTVTVPKNADHQSKLPVLVWIHGGSYELGCGDAHISDPESLVTEQNIIVVNVTYRLGYFGFLGGYDDRPANLGLFDMIEALKWIQKNIENFGGNPQNVTMMGQSSGGDAIAHLMIAEGTDGLFHRAIIQSAPLGLRSKRQKMNAFFSSKLNGLSTEKNTDTILELQKSAVPSVMKFGLKAAMPFGTQYGFVPMPREHQSLEKWKEKAGNFNIMIGLNDQETAFYAAANEKLRKKFHSKYAGKIIRKAVRITTETIYGKPAEKFAKLFAKAGASTYYFRIHSKFEGENWGAAHCFDLPLLFFNEENWKDTGLLNNMPLEEIKKYGRQIREIWASFIRHGEISKEIKIPKILEIKKM